MNILYFYILFFILYFLFCIVFCIFLQADVIMVNTCAIRENAEQKIWTRLEDFRILKRQRILENRKLAYPSIIF